MVDGRACDRCFSINFYSADWWWGCGGGGGGVLSISDTNYQEGGRGFRFVVIPVRSSVLIPRPSTTHPPPPNPLVPPHALSGFGAFFVKRGRADGHTELNSRRSSLYPCSRTREGIPSGPAALFLFYIKILPGSSPRPNFVCVCVCDAGPLHPPSCEPVANHLLLLLYVVPVARSSFTSVSVCADFHTWLNAFGKFPRGHVPGLSPPP